MKVIATFDRIIAEVLQDKVKARLTFKVSQGKDPTPDRSPKVAYIRRP